MWTVPCGLKVYLVLGYTDMRKSVNGLSLMVSEVLNQDPFSGHLFVFCNRRKKIVKILYWDRNGFCLWYKRLERDAFRWPLDEVELLQIDHHQLMWLLDGLDVCEQGVHQRLEEMVIY